MRIRELRLTDFRSYPELAVAFPPGPQVIAGPNAAGKTNLLEAIAVLASGHSHRTRADAELVRWGTGFARVEAVLGPARDTMAATGGPAPADRDPLAHADTLEVLIPGPVAVGGAGLRRQVHINGVPRRAEALAAHLRAVTFSPEAMLLVVGPPSLRRDEVDTLTSQLRPPHRRGLGVYGRALAQRNSLLRLVREERASRDELPYWDRVLVEEGSAIVERRLEALADLAAPLAAAHAEIAPDEPPLAISYAASAPPHRGESAAEALRRRLAETAEKELWNGMTLVGPHRDDAVFRLGDRELGTFGSRGQQRTAILALKLAQLEAIWRTSGAVPLLLLDDVFSELDPDRRSHLVRRIDELPQAFVTTTALADLDPELVARATAWEVAPGRLVQVAR